MEHSNDVWSSSHKGALTSLGGISIISRFGLAWCNALMQMFVGTLRKRTAETDKETLVSESNPDQAHPPV